MHSIDIGRGIVRHDREFVDPRHTGVPRLHFRIRGFSVFLIPSIPGFPSTSTVLGCNDPGSRGVDGRELQGDGNIVPEKGNTS